MRFLPGRIACVSVRTRVILMVCGLGFLWPANASGMAFYSVSTWVPFTGFTDLVNNPHDRACWNKTTIAYRFAPSFTNAFPNATLKDQVRLAFREWDEASATLPGSQPAYKHVGYQPYVDMRTVAVHEIGHMLGLAHPEEAHVAGRNYTPVSARGCTPVVVAASGGMEVMRHTLNAGNTNHVLTHDELSAYCVAYGAADLDFVETASVSATDILIQAQDLFDPNIWARALPWNVLPGTSACDRTTVYGTITFNSNTAVDRKIGRMSKGINWDYLNGTGKPIATLAITTTGTNNPFPLFHYDNPGSHPFTLFSTAPSTDPDTKEHLRHTWAAPPAAAVPAGDLLHVGLEQDVWHWCPTDITAKAPDETVTAVPPLSCIQSWMNTVVTGSPFAARPLHLTSGPPETVIAAGFIVSVPPALPSAARLSDLRIAAVGEDGLTLADLNRDTLNALEAAQRLRAVAGFGTQTLAPGTDFYVVLRGSADDVPPDARAEGRFVLATDLADLAEETLFVYVASTTDPDVGAVGTFAQINTPPLAGRTIHGVALPMLGWPPAAGGSR